MVNGMDYLKESMFERMNRLSQTMRLSMLVSVFWSVFSLIYIWEPRGPFHIWAFIQKFVLMGVLPLVVCWGPWWVAQGFKKDRS